MIEIPVAGGHVARVSDEDADLAQYKWRLTSPSRSQTRWARRSVRRGGRTFDFSMHREVAARAALDLTYQIDHEDGDGLNNQRGNLRPATGSQNVAAQRRSVKARSGFRGVYRGSPASQMAARPWRAEIKVRGRSLHLGWFFTAEEAAAAYDIAALEHFGEFAVTNGAAGG